MDIRFTCTCGRSLRVDDKHVGKTVVCPDCTARLVVPPTITNYPSPPPFQSRSHTPPPPPGPPAKKLACPTCNSDTVQKLAVIWSSGTSSTNSMSLGGGVVFGGSVAPILGTSISHGSHQTELAKMAARPEMPPDPFGRKWIWWSLLFIFLGTPILSAIGESTTSREGEPSPVGALLVLSLLFGTPYLLYKRSKEKTKKWEVAARRQHAAQLAEWNRQWFCHRCGGIFLL